MTDQEVFDKVCSAMMETGRPAVQPNGDCVQVAADGSRCAYGVFAFPPQKTADESITHGEHAPLLRSMFYIHNYLPPAYWTVGFAIVTQAFGLIPRGFIPVESAEVKASRRAALREIKKNVAKGIDATPTVCKVGA